MARFQDRNGVVATNGFYQETPGVNGSQATASRAAAKMYQVVSINPATATTYTVSIPAGSIVTDVVTNVSTGFNGTTPTIRFGTTANGTDIATGQSVASTTTAAQNSSTFAANAAGQVFVSFTGTPTTGAATALIGFVPAYKSIAV